MNLKGISLLLLGVVAVSACATIPTGPSVTVYPGPGKPFEVFLSDDAVCKQWARQQVGADLYADDWILQRRYDDAYIQCMFAKGNQVPGIARTHTGAVPPPPPPQGFIPPPSGVYLPPATGQPGTGNISPPPTTSQITPKPNEKRCQKWAPTGESHNETRWNPEKQTMETVSVPDFSWQDIPCE
jgi:hypothetical protein